MLTSLNLLLLQWFLYTDLEGGEMLYLLFSEFPPTNMVDLSLCSSLLLDLSAKMFSVLVIDKYIS